MARVKGMFDSPACQLTFQNALAVVGLSRKEQFELFRIPAVILHIGNLQFIADRSEQAQPGTGCQSVAERVCHLLGISPSDFLKSVLRPKVKAGREWVTQTRTKRQAEDELAALCKFMYEKTFGMLVNRINKALDRPSAKSCVPFGRVTGLRLTAQSIDRRSRYCWV